MDLFIDTPERAAERMERRWQEAGGRPSMSDGAFGEAARASETGSGASSLFESSYDAGSTVSELLDLDEPSGFEGGKDASPAGSGRSDHAARHGRRRSRGRASGGDASKRPPVPVEPYSTAGEAYREEKAYDRRRAKKRKLAGVLRVLAMIVLLPLALVAVFLVSYTLTCILNGASLDEVVLLVDELLAHVEALVNDISSFW